MNELDTVIIYTDGACRGNPGPGGWGVLMRIAGREKTLRGFVADTTNNRMELQAAIEALRALTPHPHQRVALYTDSQYLQNGVRTWLAQWKRKNWRTANKKPVKNRDLWEALDELQHRHEIDWHWVKAHAGHADNERADQLANRAIDEGLAA